MSELFNQIENFVKESFNKVSKEKSIKHLERTVYWIKQLKPDADDALLISAIAHDIERAFKEEKESKNKNFAYESLKYIRPHQEKGAELVSKFLENLSADKQLIKKIHHLISRHEEGGDEEQNILKDADSISFFENNTDSFLKKINIDGKEKIRSKFDWMYNRISSNKAKEFAKPMYEKAINLL